jgi:hypothetical protein
MDGGLMGIDLPESGDVITKSAIQDMHNSVRTRINSMSSQDWGRATFGFPQVNSSNASIIHHSDTVAVTSEVKVTSTGQALTTSDVLSNWQELTTYRLSTGYALDSAGNDLLFWFNCRLSEYTNAADSPKMASKRAVAAFALGWDLGSGVEIIAKSMRIVHFFKANHMPSGSSGGQEIPVSIWVHQAIPATTAGPLATLRVYAAKIAGAASSDYDPTDKFVVSAGTTGMLMFRT